MNSTLKNALSNSKTYTEKLRDIATMIKNSEGEIHLDNGDAQIIQDSSDLLQYISYMCERFYERLENEEVKK